MDAVIARGFVANRPKGIRRIMAKTSINLQDSFLNQVRKDNLEIQLVLLDGSKLQGYVRGFDNFTVIVNGSDAQHLIYKHAIMQVITTRRLADGENMQHR